MARIERDWIGKQGMLIYANAKIRYGVTVHSGLRLPQPYACFRSVFFRSGIRE